MCSIKFYENGCFYFLDKIRYFTPVCITEESFSTPFDSLQWTLWICAYCVVLYDIMNLSTLFSSFLIFMMLWKNRISNVWQLGLDLWIWLRFLAWMVTEDEYCVLTILLLLMRPIVVEKSEKNRFSQCLKTTQKVASLRAKWATFYF